MPGKTRPAKAASKANGKYSFGKSESDLHDVTLPSGGIVQARRPGVGGLIEMGLLDSFDDLTALVQTEHIDSKDGKVTPEQAKAAAENLMANKESLAAALHLIDKLTVGVVVQPLVWVDYQLEGESDEDWLKRKEQAEEDEAFPVRKVDLDDKMFLLNWAVGGTPDLKAFREGTQQLVADVAAG